MALVSSINGFNKACENGACANAEMRCNTTALWGKIVSAVTVITALVNLFSGKEGQIPD